MTTEQLEKGSKLDEEIKSLKFAYENMKQEGIVTLYCEKNATLKLLTKL